MSPRPTHFLCLPLINPASLPQFTASLARFKQDKAIQKNPVSGRTARRPPPSSRNDSDSEEYGKEGSKTAASDPQETYIPPSAIRPVGTLHLTLGVMNLDTKNKIDAASIFLKDLDVKALSQTSNTETAASTGDRGSADAPDAPNGPRNNSQSLTVQLRGIQAMQEPRKTRVLYAAPSDSSGSLLPLCHSIRDKFVESGYIIDEDRELKLHATIVNTIYVSKGSKGSRRRKLEFDATDLIDRWKDEVWAEVILDRLAICEMGAKEDKDGNVRYLEIAAIEL